MKFQKHVEALRAVPAFQPAFAAFDRRYDALNENGRPNAEALIALLQMLNRDIAVAELEAIRASGGSVQ